MNLVLDETVEQARAARTRLVMCTRRRGHLPPSAPDGASLSAPPGGPATLASAAHRAPRASRLPLQVSASEKNNMGMVVIRGNSIVMMEALEKLWGDQPGSAGPAPR
eukprot:6760873-Prymnesium_polylepis.1